MLPQTRDGVPARKWWINRVGPTPQSSQVVRVMNESIFHVCLAEKVGGRTCCCSSGCWVHPPTPIVSFSVATSVKKSSLLKKSDMFGLLPSGSSQRSTRGVLIGGRANLSTFIPVRGQRTHAPGVGWPRVGLPLHMPHLNRVTLLDTWWRMLASGGGDFAAPCRLRRYLHYAWPRWSRPKWILLQCNEWL